MIRAILRAELLLLGLCIAGGAAALGLAWLLILLWSEVLAP